MAVSDPDAMYAMAVALAFEYDLFFAVPTSPLPEPWLYAVDTASPGGATISARFTPPSPVIMCVPITSPLGHVGKPVVMSMRKSWVVMAPGVPRSMLSRPK